MTRLRPRTRAALPTIRDLAAMGCSNGQIADAVGLHRRTVARVRDFLGRQLGEDVPDGTFGGARTHARGDPDPEAAEHRRALLAALRDRDRARSGKPHENDLSEET